MIVKRTLQSICVLTVNPNTTTSIIVQVRIFTIDCEHEHLNHACIAKYLSYSRIAVFSPSLGLTQPIFWLAIYF